MSDQMRRLLISFSFGETSAYMTWWILKNNASHPDLGYDEVLVVFANTGEEWEQTLEFGRRCDEAFGFGTVWIEGVQQEGRKPPLVKVVDFETAARDGEPFESSIVKYGIPNQKFKDCTRNMKRKPIEQYAKGLGWKDYDIAIGIRADEMDRISSDTERRIIYPFATMFPVTKPMVNSWWAQQPFRLELKGYEGNCKWCWKKSDRKHFTIMQEHPEVYEFPRRMEAEHPHNGPEFRKDMSQRYSPLPEGYHRVFFRDNRSVEDMFAEMRQRVASGKFKPADDDHVVFDETLDVGGACEESCEVWADE